MKVYNDCYQKKYFKEYNFYSNLFYTYTWNFLCSGIRNYRNYVTNRPPKWQGL